MLPVAWDCRETSKTHQWDDVERDLGTVQRSPEQTPCPPPYGGRLQKYMEYVTKINNEIGQCFSHIITKFVIFDF